MFQIGRTYFGLQDFPEATSYFLEALDIRKTQLGLLHRSVFPCVEALITCYVSSQNYDLLDSLYAEYEELYAR